MADVKNRPFKRGLTKNQEINPDFIVRDTRTMGMKLADYLAEPLNVAVALGVLAAVNIMYPYFPELFLLIAFLLYRHGHKHATVIRLPIRLPQTSKLTDYTDLAPGTKKPYKGRGIFFLGNEAGTNKEIWATNEDMRTHVLVMGTTGAGKTATLSSMTLNALAQGSGYIYVDGKADNALWGRLYAMARQRGRDDDLLLISFMTGAKDIIGRQAKLMSNTVNPFTFGSSSMISQNLVSLLDDSGGGSGDMWQGRAIGFIEALARALVHMRDHYNQPLNVDVFREYFELKKLESFVWDAPKEYGMADEELVAFKPLENYLMNVPGYDKAKKGNQAQDTLQQHGFITMQLTRTTGSLADTYGHVVNARYGEVDFYDVVINRRLLMVALPALEKAPAELSNLGKIVISNLKATLASTLGADMEGDYKQIIESRPTEAKTPFLCILDEYGYYAVKGFAVVAAQARSLGFSVVFAGQDYPAFKKAGEEEAASIIGNCNIKMCMKLEDPKETWDLFKETAGESYVTHSSGFSAQVGGMTGNNYMDMNNASIERRARVELADLKEQMESESHFFFKSSIIRGDTFFAYVPNAKQIRLNSFVSVEYPEPSEIEAHLEDPEEILLEQSAILAIMRDQDEKPIDYHPAWAQVDDLIKGNRSFIPPGTVSDAVIYEAILIDRVMSGEGLNTGDAEKGVDAFIDDTLSADDIMDDLLPPGMASAKKEVNEDIDPVLAAAQGQIVDHGAYDYDPEELEPVSLLGSVVDVEDTKANLGEMETLMAEEELDPEVAEATSEKIVSEIGNGVTYTHYPPKKEDNAADIVTNAIKSLADLVGNSSGKGDN